MKISREQSGTYQKFGKQSAMVGSSWELGPASFVKQAVMSSTFDNLYHSKW